MTIQEAINRLELLKLDWGPDEPLFLARCSVANVDARPLRHIDMCPPMGKLIVGYGENPRGAYHITDDFWD